MKDKDYFNRYLGEHYYSVILKLNRIMIQTGDISTWNLSYKPFESYFLLTLWKNCPLKKFDGNQTNKKYMTQIIESDV